MFACVLVIMAFIAVKIAGGNQSPAESDPTVERGRYLVESVAMCGDCHTPRIRTGDLDRDKWLLGSTLPFKPTYPMPFAPVAPPIAGLPNFQNDELAIRFFETGKNADGKHAKVPMPQFRFDHDDAVAVVAYLRSLSR